MFGHVKGSAPSKSIVETRWAIFRKMVDGKEDVKARLVARGYQGRVQKDGSVGASRSASCRSPHLQVISLGALKNGVCAVWT